MQQPQQMQLQQQPSGSLDFIPKCWDVLNRVYAVCNTSPWIFNMPVRDVFYKPVSETFPGIAAEYYRVITNPITFAMIEDRLNRHYYTNAQMFADVSGACCCWQDVPA